MFPPDELLHEGVAVVSGVRPAVAVKYCKVQQVVMETGDTEAVLVLLPEAQNRRRADPGQTDLKEDDRLHVFMCSSVHRSLPSFILPSLSLALRRPHLWDGFSMSDTGRQQNWFLYPVVPDTK